MNKGVVYVGMSGGVDSSVSAALLKDQGYKVVGVYMKNWSKNLPGMKCPWAEDLADAKRVAVKLGIDFKVFDFEKDYKQKVVDYMLEEYKKGNTPNPDIMCNQEIKFKLFAETAFEDGADFIATGHYANVAPESDLGISEEFKRSAAGELPCNSPRVTLEENPKSLSRARLCKAVDDNKDQTYFLYRIKSEVLARTIFPVGNMKKPEVKKLAEKYGLANAHKPESMGVCFVGEANMKDFLAEFIDVKPGEIRELETDKKLGYHDGAIFYTVGQRHGLNVGSGLPYYVAKKDMDKNIVYVSKNLSEKNLWTNELILKDIFLREEPKTSEIEVRVRHRAPLIKAQFDGEKVTFENPIKRIASGQSVVFYEGDVCLGGGIIA